MPHSIFNRGIKILCQRINIPCRQVKDEQLNVVVTGYGLLANVTAYATKAIRSTRYQELASIRRKPGRAIIGRVLPECIDCSRLQVHQIHALQVKWRYCVIWFKSAEQYLTAISADVFKADLLFTKGEPSTNPAGNIIPVQ